MLCLYTSSPFCVKGPTLEWHVILFCLWVGTSGSNRVCGKRTTSMSGQGSNVFDIDFFLLQDQRKCTYLFLRFRHLSSLNCFPFLFKFSSKEFLIAHTWCSATLLCLKSGINVHLNTRFIRGYYFESNTSMPCTVFVFPVHSMLFVH